MTFPPQPPIPALLPFTPGEDLDQWKKENREVYYRMLYEHGTECEAVIRTMHADEQAKEFGKLNRFLNGILDTNNERIEQRAKEYTCQYGQGNPVPNPESHTIDPNPESQTIVPNPENQTIDPDEEDLINNEKKIDALLNELGEFPTYKYLEDNCFGKSYNDSMKLCSEIRRSAVALKSSAGLMCWSGVRKGSNGFAFKVPEFYGEDIGDDRLHLLPKHFEDLFEHVRKMHDLYLKKKQDDKSRYLKRRRADESADCVLRLEYRVAEKRRREAAPPLRITDHRHYYPQRGVFTVLGIEEAKPKPPTIEEE